VVSQELVVSNSMPVAMQLASLVKRVVQAIKEPLDRTEVEAIKDVVEEAEAAVVVIMRTPEAELTTVKSTEEAVMKITATAEVKATVEQEAPAAVKVTEVMLKETEAAVEVVVETLSVKVSLVPLVIVLLVRTIAHLARTETAVAVTIKLLKRETTPVVETKEVSKLAAEVKTVVKEEPDLLVVELMSRKALPTTTEQSHSSTLGEAALRTTLQLVPLSFLVRLKPRA